MNVPFCRPHNDFLLVFHYTISEIIVTYLTN